MIANNLVDKLPRHSWKRYSKRDLKKIKRIVIHHFAGNISIHEAAKYHVSKGWPGLGYHYVIDYDGSINICNYIDTISYNVGNNNTPTIGIAIRGDWSDQLPDSCMLFALDELIESIRLTSGYLPVFGHDDFRNTECPGLELKKWIDNKYGHQPQGLKVEFTKLQRFWRWLVGARDRDHI